MDSRGSSADAFRTVEKRRNVETIIRRWRGSQLLRCGLGRIQGQLRIGDFCSPLPDQVGAEIDAFVADERGLRSSADENEHLMLTLAAKRAMMTLTFDNGNWLARLLDLGFQSDVLELELARIVFEFSNSRLQTYKGV